jgi:hypothetical protein
MSSPTLPTQNEMKSARVGTSTEESKVGNTGNAEKSRTGAKRNLGTFGKKQRGPKLCERKKKSEVISIMEATALLARTSAKLDVLVQDAYHPKRELVDVVAGVAQCASAFSLDTVKAWIEASVAAGTILEVMNDALASRTFPERWRRDKL